VLASAARAPRTTPGTPATGFVSAASDFAAPSRTVAAAEREPVLEHSRARVGRAQASVREPRARGARKEREFLDEFLALERAQPGALVARAEEVLASAGPPAEKVALLRAIEGAGSQERLRWLEHAVRTLGGDPGDPGEDASSVASFALGELVRASRVEREARPALLRLAFETRGLAARLRRDAATGYARSAADPELETLRVPLARESDPLLVAGVVAALRERPECPRAARLLDELAPELASVPATAAE